MVEGGVFFMIKGLVFVMFEVKLIFDFVDLF